MLDKKLKIPQTLDHKKCESIAQVLNPLVASIFALYVKTKNYHWHLMGPHFRDYHLLFDEQAAQVLEMVDTLAERVRKLGCPTITSIGHIAQQTIIADDNELGPSAEKMLKNLMKDNLALADLMRQAHAVADKNGDWATTSTLEIYLDETERRVWFLAATLG